MADADIDGRLADEVTVLLTKLVTEVAKLLFLEETVVQLRREHAQQAKKVSDLSAVEAAYTELQEKFSLLSETHKLTVTEKAVAQEKNKQLEAEVEDLTASLFNEANEMVSNASREAYNYKLKNRKLIEELGEKDAIIDNLQAQLRDLKTMFATLEDQQRLASRAQTPQLESRGFEPSLATPKHPDADTPAVLSQFVYGPRAVAIRYDLPVYQLEYKAFVYQLIKKDFAFDLASLKALKYFRRIWAEEIEPAVPTIPALTGSIFANRWTKGKSFWGLLVEGKAIIEPVAGVNETFKLSYKGAKTGHEVPVAMKEPCSFCGEAKDDLLEHARLYNLKLYGPATETGSAEGSTTEIGGEIHLVVGTYPLCNFCLVKLRAVCTFFARLRFIHSNIYKLKQNLTFDDIAFVNNFQFKRMSTDLLQPPHSDPADEPVLMKLYVMLLALRAKIFWSRIGFWDTDEDVECINLDEVKVDVFRDFIGENVAFQEKELKVIDESDAKKEGGDVDAIILESLESSPKQTEGGVEEEASGAEVAVPEETMALTLQETEVPALDEDKLEDGDKTEDGDDDKEVNGQAEPQGKSAKKKKKKKGKKKAEEPVPDPKEATSDDEGFEDTSEVFEGGETLTRRKSKSKEFKAKMNKGLEDTMAMLQESIE